MARVTQEQIEKLQAWIDSLPEDSRNKCALCTETLTHIVKTAEVETGAGTATVTRVLSEKINETAAPADRVSGDQLRTRVNRNEGLLGRNDQINKHKHMEMKKRALAEEIKDSGNGKFEPINDKSFNLILKEFKETFGELIKDKKPNLKQAEKLFAIAYEILSIARLAESGEKWTR